MNSVKIPSKSDRNRGIFEGNPILKVLMPVKFFLFLGVGVLGVWDIVVVSGK